MEKPNYNEDLHENLSMNDHKIGNEISSLDHFEQTNRFIDHTISDRHSGVQDKNLDFSIIELNNEGVKCIDETDKFNKYKKTYDLVILITAYDETIEEYENTIQKGIDKNIEDLYNNGCKSICVIVIVDGLTPYHKASKSHIPNAENNEKSIDLKTHKCKECKQEIYFDKYTDDNLLKRQDSYPENPEKLKNPRAYTFCKKFNISEQKSYNMIFCIKEENKGKLNSHSWFLKGFCKTFEPEFIIFLDVGTKPLQQSLSRLYNCLSSSPNIAGCCGEIIPAISKTCTFVENAQKFEYKVSHIFDKAMESLFGFISVLPGAFSAYRFECLNKDEILESYFKTENNSEISMFDANMYLAEDRILCLQLVCVKNERYVLRYVSDSYAETDVPDEIYKLMVQRRRWNNGAWFSSIYTILNWTKIFKSGHGRCRNACFILLMLYYVLIAIFSWVLVGAYYLIFCITLKKTLGESSNDLNKLNKFSSPIIMFYVSTLIALVICSLSSKLQEIRFFLNFLSFIYGIYTVGAVFLSFFYFFQFVFSFEQDELEESSLLLMLGILIFLMGLNICLNGIDSICTVFCGMLQYLWLSGTYVNMILIYSICNIHDASWGNRPGHETLDRKQKEKEDKQKQSFEEQRCVWLSIWIISNLSFAYLFNWTSGDDDENTKKCIIYLAWIAGVIMLIKVIAAIINRCKNCCSKSRKVYIDPQASESRESQQILVTRR